MGKKFKLSDMIPNAWFYKLKYMNKTSKDLNSSMNSSMLNKLHLSPPKSSIPSQPEPECGSRKSYHITRELSIDLVKSPPCRKKSKSRRSTRRSSSISSFSCQSSSTSMSIGSKSRSPPSPPSKKETDVVTYGDNVGFLVEHVLLKNKQNILDRNALADNKPEHFDTVLKTTQFQLSPIITKKTTKEQKQKPNNSPPSRKMSISSPGKVRLKINSPRFLRKNQGQNGHKNVTRKVTSSRKSKSISESFAIVKSSFDPQKDFEESMVEMIVQNNLTATKDLEDLLACYLSLNSDEYHDIIIKVFKQIWFDFRHR